MTVPGNIDALLLGGQRGYQIERSLRFNSPDSAYLNRTYSGACQDAKLMTISVWVKRGRLTTSGQQPIFSSYSAVRFGGDLTWTAADKIQFRPGGNGDGVSNQYSISTDAVFRDPSAWYHIVIQYDSTQATSTNRQKIYVNGVQQTVTGNYPTQNYLHTYAFNNANNQIGAYTSYGTDYLDSYLTEFHFIDGQALTPSSFGETDTITGVWKPKRYAGTYGTNGFYLKFADNSGTTSTTLGKDSSGNGNNWTPNNFSITAGAGNDSLTDVPTNYADGGNGRGNYCTGNPLYIPSSNSRMSLTNGNLEWGQAATNANSSMAGTFLMRSGKWYWEVTVGGSLSVAGIGMQTDVNTAWRGGGTVLYRSDGQKSIGGTASAYGASYTTNDVLGFAYDADAGTLTCYKNNTSQGTIYSSGTGNSWLPAIHDDNAGVGVTYYHQLNFGQRSFAYTPPAGFSALNTQNLPEPSIKKPSSYFNTVLWTGNTSTAGVTQAITGVGFASDFVWVKTRNQVFNHFQYDSVRGVGSSGKLLQSNTTAAELTNGEIDSLDADGFTVKYVNTNTLNWSSSNNVAWCWKKSATPGFDIVTYTGDGVAGRTVSHALGVAPQLIMIKARSAANAWNIYTTVIDGSLDFFAFDTGAKQDSTQAVPTSSVFSVSAGANVNGNGVTYVAYCWAPVAGFSRFGAYTGNGNADGPFVFTGMRPAYVMIKRTDAANNWAIHDKSRVGYNVANYHLLADSSSAEFTDIPIDFLSNGFKLRGTSGTENASGGTYVFAAFAESPFKYSLAR